MFNAEEFYREAHNAEDISIGEFISYIKGFDKLILWGAGNLGVEIGKKFIELNLPITCYWDIRARDILKLNDIKVIEPFTGEFNRESAIVILCITNPFYSSELGRKLDKEKLQYLWGFDVYQGIACPLNTKNFDTGICCQLQHCNVCNCERLFNVAQKVKKIENKPFFNSFVFPVTQKCSLNCKYCSVYMTNYTNDRRINFPLQRILDDIDRFSDAASYIARAVAYGGEPFLHPDIDKIIKKLAEKKNIGIVSVATNGVFNISKKVLEKLHYDNLRIDFSNYSEVLTNEQIEIVNRNFELFKSEGIEVNMSNICPQWAIPSSFEKINFTPENLRNKKGNCFELRQECCVKNGKFFPCGKCDSVHSLGIADYPTDYVDITKSTSTLDLTRKIQDCLELPFYESCRHCGESGFATKAAEQGYFDFIGNNKQT